MTIDLKGKVVLITGASSGFGMDAAYQFARQGCSVVLAARRIDRLQELAAAIQKEGGDVCALGGRSARGGPRPAPSPRSQAPPFDCSRSPNGATL